MHCIKIHMNISNFRENMQLQVYTWSTKLTLYCKGFPQLWLWHCGMPQHLVLYPVVHMMRYNVSIVNCILGKRIKYGLNLNMNSPGWHKSARLCLTNLHAPFQVLEALHLLAKPILHLGTPHKDQYQYSPPSTRETKSPPVPLQHLRVELEHSDWKPSVMCHIRWCTYTPKMVVHSYNTRAGSLPSRAWIDLSDPNNFRAIGWFGPKTSPDASWQKKLTQTPEWN